MPIYDYRCEECGLEAEILRGVGSEPPLCCDGSMTRVPTFPAMIRVRDERGSFLRSKGYKEGYAKDYGKDVPTPWNS